MTKDEIKQWIHCNTGLMCPNLTDVEIDHIVMCLDHLLIWYKHGHQIGSFLTAVAKNDFRRACLNADDTNQKALYLYALFVSNHLNSDYIKKAEALKY